VCDVGKRRVRAGEGFDDFAPVIKASNESVQLPRQREETLEQVFELRFL